jgi:branched-chain amino acid transport system substrate-binding protein
MNLKNLIGIAGAGFLLPVALHAQEIVIGQTLPLTGSQATAAVEAQRGAEAFIKALNAQGGVASKKLALKTLDDALKPEQAVANTRELAKTHRAVALVSAMFAPSITAIAPVAAEENLPLIGVMNGNSVLRDKNNGIIHVRASFVKEVEKTVQHYSTSGAERFALFHPNDAAGMATGKTMQDALAAKGLKPVIDIAFDRAAVDYKPYAEQIRAAKADVVIIASPVKPAAELIAAVRSQPTTMAFTCLSVVDDRALFAALKDKVHGVTFSSIVPNPYDNRIPIVADYQKAMVAAGHKVFSLASMESYLNTLVAVEAIRRAGTPITAERVRAAVKTFPDQNFRGVRLIVARAPLDNGLDSVDIVMLKRDGTLVR